MKWRQTRRSGNVQERRGGIPGTVQIGGLGLIVLVAASLLLGADPATVLQMLPSTAGEPAVVGTPEPGTLGDFVSQVLADTEDTWAGIFADDLGAAYEPASLVIFDELVESACGMAQSAVGPFYCPANQTIYVDLSFFNDLDTEHGAPGDFAQAYVISHEVGHHVQMLLGTMTQVDAQRRALPEAEGRDLGVRLELQADCYSGVWANRAQQERLVLDQADLQEGLRAAQAVGDDRLQMRSRGYVVPDSFTHGSSAQRAEWFLRGFESGSLEACNTFTN
jgi:predicted metalloprotease